MQIGSILFITLVCTFIKSEGIARIKSMTEWNKKIMNNPNPVYVLFYKPWAHNQFYDVASALTDYTCSRPMFAPDDQPQCSPKIYSIDKNDVNLKNLPQLQQFGSTLEAMAFKNGQQIGETVEGYEIDGNSVPIEHKKLLDSAVGREINSEYRWPKVFI